MDAFWIQGVVKNGQVVLETPLDLPDGTVVTVMNNDSDDMPKRSETHDPEKARQLLFALVGRPELAGDPDWKNKLACSK